MKRLKEAVNKKLKDDLFNSDLTDKEIEFILRYLESYNAAHSYLKVYGGDKTTARQYAYNLLQRSNIKAQIKKLKKVMQVGYDIDPSRYIEFLLKAANADIGDYIKFSEEEVPVYDKSGMMMVNPDTGEPIVKKVNKMHLADSNEIDTSIITAIKQGRDGITIELVDKLKCWEKIKEFFEWKKSEEDKSIAETNIIEAIKGSTKKSWKEDVYDDLNETLRDGK